MLVFVNLNSVSRSRYLKSNVGTHLGKYTNNDYSKWLYLLHIHHGHMYNRCYVMHINFIGPQMAVCSISQVPDLRSNRLIGMELMHVQLDAFYKSSNTQCVSALKKVLCYNFFDPIIASYWKYWNKNFFDNQT